MRLRSFLGPIPGRGGDKSTVSGGHFRLPPIRRQS
jgi:hypothetical protein